MGTAILVRSDNSFVKSHRNPNRKKRNPNANHNSPDHRNRNCIVMKQPGSNLVMGKVKILKRGENLSPDFMTTTTTNKKKTEKNCYDLDLGSTDRLGPDPLTVNKQVSVHHLTDRLYAGPTSVLSSPPPIFVPIPRFLCLTTWFIHSFMIMVILDCIIIIIHKRRMFRFCVSIMMLSRDDIFSVREQIMFWRRNFKAKEQSKACWFVQDFLKWRKRFWASLGLIVS
jgi:hypothetical protein